MRKVTNNRSVLYNISEIISVGFIDQEDFNTYSKRKRGKPKYQYLFNFLWDEIINRKLTPEEIDEHLIQKEIKNNLKGTDFNELKQNLYNNLLEYIAINKCKDDVDKWEAEVEIKLPQIEALIKIGLTEQALSLLYKTESLLPSPPNYNHWSNINLLLRLTNVRINLATRHSDIMPNDYYDETIKKIFYYGRVFYQTNPNDSLLKEKVRLFSFLLSLSEEEETIDGKIRILDELIQGKDHFEVSDSERYSDLVKLQQSFYIIQKLILLIKSNRIQRANEELYNLERIGVDFYSPTLYQFASLLKDELKRSSQNKQNSEQNSSNQKILYYNHKQVNCILPEIEVNICLEKFYSAEYDLCYELTEKLIGKRKLFQNNKDQYLTLQFLKYLLIIQLNKNNYSYSRVLKQRIDIPEFEFEFEFENSSLKVIEKLEGWRGEEIKKYKIKEMKSKIDELQAQSNPLNQRHNLIMNWFKLRNY